MTAREMHYDFKQKLNKIDSQKYRDLLVPEIDWKINEAQELFVKIVAEPRIQRKLGFEVNQRTIDDIRTLVITQKPEEGIELTAFDDSSFTGTLPTDYWFLIKSYVIASKANCLNKRLEAREIQHDDIDDASPFDVSSFEWRVCNIRYYNGGIKVSTDGTFTPTKLVLDYIKRPRIIHNAQDFGTGSYVTIGGQTLSGTQSCELPEGVHREIIDLAVAITAGDLDLSNYQMKLNKLSLTDIK